MSELRTSRRIVFHGLGALGVAVALAGCGGADEPTTSSSPSDDAGTSDPATSSAPTSDPAATSSAAEPTEAPADGLVATADVPVGGGVVLLDENIVVVQPTEGAFLAYSASCTHQGTQVVIDDEGIYCPTHGSRFSAEDGSPTAGPASAPLGEVSVSVVGDQVVAA
jgi:nitrite reductase/ring-hydroxylating ferredoxin subunit